MKYERPDLEEMELEFEGSFLECASVGGDRNDNEIEDGEEFG